MAKYIYKKEDELTVVWIGRDKYILCECTQEQLRKIYDNGLGCVDKEAEKKSAPKKEKEEE